MYRAHVIRLYPNKDQATYLAKCCGISRFAYNWALARWNETEMRGEIPSCNEIRKNLNAIKREQFPWMMEVTKCAPMSAIEDLQCAFNNYFGKRANRPKMKSKGRIKESFRIGMESGNFSFNGENIRIPRLGWIKTAERFRWPNSKMISVTIKKTGDRWYASVKCELEEAVMVYPETAAIGVDLGLKSFATLSTGEVIELPKNCTISSCHERRLVRSISRKVSGSQNWKKAKSALDRRRGTATNARNHFLHRITSKIAMDHNHIAIEDLDVSTLGNNTGKSKHVYESGFRTFRDLLQYKAKKLTICSRWFPSSKTCSNCGTKQQHLPLSARSWACQKCGMVHDRDHNAAKNLAQIATRPVAISAMAACGDLGEGRSMKQEICTK